MNKLYCVRADFGAYTPEFINGGFIAIGWIQDMDLSAISSRDELYPIYKVRHPKDTSNVVIGQQVGQIARFLLEIEGGDYVITPAANTEFIYWGIVEAHSYYYQGEKDLCPYRHRKRVKWTDAPIRRAEFSVPFQNTIRSSLAVYQITHTNNFFEVIGKKDLIKVNEVKDYYETVLERILELDAKEFEILIKHVLSALGFETEHTGKVNDGGVDVRGELNIFNIAKIQLVVQAKRYKLGSKISANTVKELRQNIPQGAQGAFITTADYHKDALIIATEQGYPRIGTITGRQLVDVLTQNWIQMPADFQEKLGLKIGLVIS